ncbi:hypothetical protein D3C87_1029140 [compost metagenome]
MFICVKEIVISTVAPARTGGEKSFKSVSCTEHFSVPLLDFSASLHFARNDDPS